MCMRGAQVAEQAALMEQQHEADDVQRCGVAMGGWRGMRVLRRRSQVCYRTQRVGEVCNIQLFYEYATFLI